MIHKYLILDTIRSRVICKDFLSIDFLFVTKKGHDTNIFVEKILLLSIILLFIKLSVMDFANLYLNLKIIKL
jgi:hypothetical protein